MTTKLQKGTLAHVQLELELAMDEFQINPAAHVFRRMLVALHVYQVAKLGPLPCSVAATYAEFVAAVVESRSLPGAHR